MSGQSRAALGIVLGALLLVGMSWFDADPLWRAQREASASLSTGGYSLMWVLGALAMSGSVLVLGALAWWSRSAVLGVVYLVGGAVFTFTPVLVINSVALPDWLSEGLAGRLAITSPLDAGVTVGAGMLLAGLVALWAWARDRRSARTSGPTEVPVGA